MSGRSYALAKEGGQGAALSLRNKVRSQARATGAGKIGRCIVGETPVARLKSAVPPLNSRRLREIELVISRRHGPYIPDGRDTEDLDSCLAYLRAAAGSGVGGVRGWARRWAPWLTDDDILAELDATEARLARSKRGRFMMLPADDVAKMLGVTLAERSSLDLRTIGACDVTKAERKAIAKELKRQRDCERQARIRKEKRPVPRDEWVANSQEAKAPWRDEGISRATWFRRKKARETGMLASTIDSIAGEHHCLTERGAVPQSGYQRGRECASVEAGCLGGGPERPTKGAAAPPSNPRHDPGHCASVQRVAAFHPAGRRHPSLKGERLGSGD